MQSFGGHFIAVNDGPYSYNFSHSRFLLQPLRRNRSLTILPKADTADIPPCDDIFPPHIVARLEEVDQNSFKI